jgi:hypothetical protein
MPPGHAEHMFSPRRGVLVALIVGSIVGGTASAPIVSASSHTAHQQPAPRAQQQGAQPSWSGT